MESIRYQDIAEFSRGQVELNFEGEARVEWRGLRIASGLTTAEIARQFVVSRDKIDGYYKCFVLRQPRRTGAKDVANLFAQSVCFLLPEAGCLNSNYRLTASVRFEKSTTIFGMHCASETLDIPVLLSSDELWQRETFRQHLDLSNASVSSMIDIKDGRNCGLWIRFEDQPEQIERKPKRFFGIW